MKNKINLLELKTEGYSEPSFVPHRIEKGWFVIAFVTEGDTLSDISGNNYLTGPGQLILVPECNTIDIKYFNNCKGFHGSFPMSFLKDASYQILRSPAPHIQSFWFDDAVFMANLFKRMMTAFQDKDQKFLQSAMDLILCQIHPSGKIALIPEKFLNMVFDGGAPLSVAEYASRLEVTPNYLNKTVKHNTRRTAIDWIEIARLNQAKKLLKDPSVPIADVAGMVGLPDQSYFARFFKKKTGLTPSEFRNQ